MASRKNSVLEPADDAYSLPPHTHVFGDAGSSDAESPTKAAAAHTAATVRALMRKTLLKRKRQAVSDASSSENEPAACGGRAAALVLQAGGCTHRAAVAATRARESAHSRQHTLDTRASRDAAEVDEPIRAARLRGYIKRTRRKKIPAPSPPPPGSPGTHAPAAPPAPKRVREHRFKPSRRKSRRPTLWRFFVAWKRIEHKGQHVHDQEPLTVRSAKLLLEFKTLSGPMQYYWVHMFELWRLYERQQIALRSPLASESAGRERAREMLLAFYYLDLAQQKLLVDDWIVERTARQRERRAADLETCLARKTLARIKTDILAVVGNIDYVLREARAPHVWQGAFEGI